MAVIENVSYQFKEHEVREIANRIADHLQKEIDRGHRVTAFTILISLALLVDFWEVIGTITLLQIALNVAVIGFVIEALPPLILYFFMRQQGWFLQRKIGNVINKYELQIIFWLLSFVDAIPVIEILPLQTFGVLKVWKKVKKNAAEAKVELAELQYTAAEEIERIREEEAEEIEIEKMEEAVGEGESSYVREGDEVGQSFPAPLERSKKSNIVEEQEAGGQTESTGKVQKGSQETMEEIFIPQEVRDPLGKLKKDFFETPPDKMPSETPTNKKLENDDSFKKAA